MDWRLLVNDHIPEFGIVGTTKTTMTTMTKAVMTKTAKVIMTKRTTTMGFTID